MAGIPAIKPYLMPTAVDLPGNTTRWTLDPEHAVLLLHDMQRYFLQPFPDTFRDQLITNAALLRERAVASGIPVTYTAQPGGMTDEQRGLLKDFWGSGMSVDPAERKVGPLAPAAVEAFANDIQPFLVADAVADFSEEYHRFAVEYVAKRCAAVVTAKEVLA